MKLQLKHIMPYLLYDVKCLYDGGHIDGISFDYLSDFGCEYFKPILRPLSDLTNEDFKEDILHYYENLGIDIKLVNYDSGNDNPFDITLTATSKLMDDVFTDILINRGSTSETPYHFFNWLCKNHFDVFNLIPEGLAIDINTL